MRLKDKGSHRYRISQRTGSGDCQEDGSGRAKVVVADLNYEGAKRCTEIGPPAGGLYHAKLM